MTESEQTRLASIVNHSDDAIVGKDLDLTITSWNAGAERMYGYTAQEIIGRRFGVLIPPERAGEDGAIIRRVLAGETVDHFETARLHRDGRKVDVSVSVFAIRDPSGRIIGASSIARDISGARALVRAQDQVIERLLFAAEFRDDALAGHIVRMSRLCGEIAAVLGLDPKRVADIESAATLHDVGKIAVPDSILLKPGPLSGEERAVMQTHTEVGHRMLSGTGIELIDQAAEIALTHHERFDGGGYPGGLLGEAIPICGRIAAVADVFDALTSDRVYRPAFTRDQAIEMMRAESGTQLDPTILEALLEVLDSERSAADARRQVAGGSETVQQPAAARSASDPGQAGADRDRAAAGRDRAAADRDHAAADSDHLASDRDLSQAEAEQRSSDRDEAALDRELAAADRQHAATDRLAAVQDREQAEAELRRARIDQLTGALGRELGIATLEREINRARHGNGRVVLAYVDVDGLKQVNDRLGHAAGDALLRDVVAAIQPHLRSYDPIVRVGGDEFVCALGQCVPEDAHRRFQAIAATLARTRPGASISVGFAELRPEDTLEQLTQRGDRALYEAKQST